MGNRKLYLIDATAFCYRAFYAIRGLSTSFGQPTGAIYGFVNILSKILKEERPDYLAACFDVSRDTFRQKKFAEYKIQRPPMPDALSSQIPFIKEIISAYGIALFEQEGYEADDIIATVARQAKEYGLSVVAISSDKDILQLVGNDVAVFSLYKEGGLIYDAKAVLERFGVEPEKIVDVLALMGDETDNIPGVRGIGEKTAVELIKRFGSLENLLSNTDRIDNARIRDVIRESLDKIKLNKELAALKDNVDLDFDLDKLKIGKSDYKELFRLFKYLEFRRFLKDLPYGEEIPQATTVAPKYNDKEIQDLLSPGDELFLYGLELKDAVFYAKNNFFRLEEPGDNIRAILSNPKIKKISHDLKKIKISLAKADFNLSGMYFDTMIADYLLEPSKSEYNFIKTGNKTDNLGAVDSIRQLRPRLEEELRDKSLLNLFFDIEMPLTEVLADMELYGVKLDLQVLRALSSDIEKRLAGLIEDIYRISGTQFNINSPKQLREILFKELKLPVIKKSKTGPSTDEEVLKRLSNKHRLPALLLEYRQLMKLKTTYIDTLPVLVDVRTNRIHTSFNQTATETGRLSSSNPNLQNIPVKTDIGRNIRRAVIASQEDGCLLSCDYSQIELRILAHLSKDKNLIFAFQHDKDIHKSTASLIYGLREDDITDSMRESAKRVNFGIIYGLSAYGLSRDLDISVEDAQMFIDTYFLRYSGVKDYIQEQIGKAQKQGFVTTILGRRRYITEINNKNQGIRQFAQRQAINTPIQGSASDLIKLAMIQIHGQIKQGNLRSKMMLQIHDELVFDVPVRELSVLIELVKCRMENVLKLEVPIKVDMKKGKNWLEMESV